MGFKSTWTGRKLVPDTGVRSLSVSVERSMTCTFARSSDVPTKRAGIEGKAGRPRISTKVNRPPSIIHCSVSLYDPPPPAPLNLQSSQTTTSAKRLIWPVRGSTLMIWLAVATTLKGQLVIPSNVWSVCWIGRRIDGRNFYEWRCRSTLLSRTYQHYDSLGSSVWRRVYN